MASNFFSIVVPALNEEKYLQVCLESLKNQDFKGKYEIIVVDNGSTDGTVRVARELGAKVILCEKKGVAYARQAGAEASSGDIIIQADADTFYPVNWLSRIDRDFIRHPKAAGLAGTYVYLNQPRWANIEYFLRYLGNILSIIFLGNASLISGANFAFRREAFNKARGYSEHSLYPDQWGIAHRLSKYGKIYYNRSLYVKTSARRLNKPFIRVFFDVGVNTGRVFKHFFNFLKLECKTAQRRRYRHV